MKQERVKTSVVNSIKSNSAHTEQPENSQIEELKSLIDILEEEIHHLQYIQNNFYEQPYHNRSFQRHREKFMNRQSRYRNHFTPYNNYNNENRSFPKNEPTHHQTNIVCETSPPNVALNHPPEDPQTTNINVLPSQDVRNLIADDDNYGKLDLGIHFPKTNSVNHVQSKGQKNLLSRKRQITKHQVGCITPKVLQDFPRAKVDHPSKSVSFEKSNYSPPFRYKHRRCDYSNRKCFLPKHRSHHSPISYFPKVSATRYHKPGSYPPKSSIDRNNPRNLFNQHNGSFKSSGYYDHCYKPYKFQRRFY
ncbi:hypothetical protein M8J77_015764 [Diaphorina citri]|nr:hypothetical protein M8J77_015764 [Diaphorina citri]